MAGIHGVHDRPAANAKPIVRRLCTPLPYIACEGAWTCRVACPADGVVRIRFFGASGPACSHCGERGLPASLGRSAHCADGDRGCPCDRTQRGLRARTNSGQRRRSEPRTTSFAHVRGHMEVQAGAYCKTVGSAYVGSNPTPATRFRSSEPVTWDCVTGSCVQRERLRRPPALVVGHGWARSSHPPMSAMSDPYAF